MGVSFRDGFVMSCFEPVMTITEGVKGFPAWKVGTKMLRRFTTLKRLGLELVF